MMANVPRLERGVYEVPPNRPMWGDAQSFGDRERRHNREPKP